MKYEAGVTNERGFKTFNSAKEIAKERDAKLMLWHSDAMIQARTGKKQNSPDNFIESDKEIRYNQMDGVADAISAQEELISTFRANILKISRKKWERKFKTEKEQEENPFEYFDCDYKKIKELRDMLGSFRKEIKNAEKTRTEKDDFILKKVDSNGNEKWELTENFWEIIGDLEDTFEKINYILQSNKCISYGDEDEDEVLTYEQQTEEFMRRFEEA